jgi:hypothetical protein
MKYRLRVLPLAAAGLIMTAACASHQGQLSAITTAQRCTGAKAVILIVGAHQNAPKPMLDPPVVCQLTTAIEAGDPVRIVVASSQPQVITPQLPSQANATLAEQHSPWVEGDVERVEGAVAAARPEAPGVDDLAALEVAADEARALGASDADLVLVDSGLDDRGAVDFTVPGLVAATPAEVVGQLKATGNVPDLQGFTVTLVGIGYTAAPVGQMAQQRDRDLGRDPASCGRQGGGNPAAKPGTVGQHRRTGAAGPRARDAAGHARIPQDPRLHRGVASEIPAQHDRLRRPGRRYPGPHSHCPMAGREPVAGRPTGRHHRRRRSYVRPDRLVQIAGRSGPCSPDLAGRLGRAD